ncbi:MAG: ankyrin repeat domain-containing protein, partial [Planctomycetota bacterium]
MRLHRLLDFGFGRDGDAVLRTLLEGGADPNGRAGPASETPLHVATRRRRVGACATLLDHGAAIDAKTGGGKTPYAHAIRRGFDDVVELLVARGADQALEDADRFAVAVVSGRLDDAREMIETRPDLVRTGNPEEDRLLADVAGRGATEPVELLVRARADLAAPGLDDGTPL